MPKPHFPPHAGPYPAAWAAEARSPHPVESQPRNRVAVEAEIARLRRELAQIQADEEAEHEAAGGASRSVRMLWCAVGLCAAAMFFAFFALLHHG